MAQQMSSSNGADVDLNIVELWLTKDVIRWKAGIFGGLVAGLFAQLVGGFISSMAGYEFIFPAKLMAAALCGPAATNYDAGIGHVLVGFLFIELWGAIWGF